ncbi:MAG: S8 family serine peptidase, partial [Geodermatophilaceae bacterium]|nr:S8 family serine peptidase [Geodermatophilaceae bacterium]
LRVFGCEGSTDVTGQALEYSADPNGDGSTDDKLDVVNLSLGSSFAPQDDADGILAGQLMDLGVMMVLSAGNSGDTYNADGAPGNNPQVLSVAASDDGFSVFDGWEIVNQPDLFEPDVRPGLRSVLYEGTGDITAPLTLPVAGDDPTACTPLSGDYSGEVLVIEADGFACGSITKSGNAKAAGAAGFVIIADDDALETGINGDPEIPGILITASDGATVTAALESGEELIISFGDSYAGVAKVDNPAAVDTLASFSSRGSRNSVKPDITAPGVNTVSAKVGTGSQSLTISGTSMASPATAGTAALVRAQHPEWTPAQVKADLMNTAVHDLYTEQDQTGLIYAPNRVGAGRLDAQRAVNNEVLAYVSGTESVVSASFGVVEVADPIATISKTIIVENTSDRQRTYDLRYDAVTEQPGVRFLLNQRSITVAANSTKTFNIRMVANRDQLRKTIDPTVSRTQVDIARQYVADASGRILLTPRDSSLSTLRVPVHANAKPSSTLTEELTPSGDNTGVITLDGRGVANGEAGGEESYTSTVSAFSLLGTSPELPVCGDDGGEPEPTATAGDCAATAIEKSYDLANVGVTSDAGLYGEDDSYLYFAIGTHAPLVSHVQTQYSVYIDGNSDGKWDYQLLTTYFTDGADPTDVPVVIAADRDGNLLPSNEEPTITFLNGAPGSLDTNLKDTSAITMVFPVADLPRLFNLNPRFGFGVQSVGYFGSVDNLGTTVSADGFPELADQTMSYNVRNPSLTFSVGEGDDAVPAYLAFSGDGTTIDVTTDLSSYTRDRAVGGPKGIMLVHTHNVTGDQVHTIPLPSGINGTVIG